MPEVTKPYDVGYPVNFEPNGDTTTEAFYKHIQEIKRIYGILRVLDEGQMDADDIRALVNNAINSMKSTWKPSLTFSDISGTLDGSRISGNINASLIKGALTNATIPNANVTGLANLINNEISKIPEPVDKGDGITSWFWTTSSGDRSQGSVTFRNGLMINWGSIEMSEGVKEGHVSFHKAFPNMCLTVVGSSYAHDGQIDGRGYGNAANSFHINAWDKNGFGYYSYIKDEGCLGLTFIAIGR